jgi:hypothetical protein
MCVAMRSRNQRSCEITSTLPANLERVFERAQRLDVEIVRRLVEQQHVAALEQRRARCSRPRSPPESVPTTSADRPLKLKRPR